MKKLLLIVTVALMVFTFSINTLCHYSFLSDEANIALENLKEKYRVDDRGYLRFEFIGFLDYVGQLLLGKPIAFLDDNVKENDANSFPDAADSNIGDTFTGPSGQCYRLEPLSFQEQRASDDAGFTVVGEWKPIEQ